MALSVFQTEITATGFSVTSIDTDNDGTPGTAMNNGVFPGWTFAFSGDFVGVPEVPVPAAVWLFGSGLLGLLAVARRRKGVDRSCGVIH